MGRAFEFRKARKMKRWSNMAKTFTRIGREIIIAVKDLGPDPISNSKLRAIIQNAKAANMPKENIERAIKKASEKSTEDFKEVLLEGYAPHGIAILVEAATDNNNRTVANIRSYFNKCDGNLATSGSVDFLFKHLCFFQIKDEGLDIEELELDLIDFGAIDLSKSESEISITANFQNFGSIQKELEKNKKKENARLSKMRDWLIEQILQIPKTRLNGHPTKRLANNINISILDIEGEATLLYLDEIGVQASTGSACTSESLEPSHVIRALGRPYEAAHGSIRFTLGKHTTQKDLKYLVSKLPDIVEHLRKASPVDVDMDTLDKSIKTFPREITEL